MYPKKGGDLIKVIHRVNQKIVVTECESVRGSNVSGYIDLLRVKKSGIAGRIKKDENSRKIESLCPPPLVQVHELRRGRPRGRLSFTPEAGSLLTGHTYYPYV